MGGRNQETKQTHVVRYYGEEGTNNEDFWVDVETLDKAHLSGRQGSPSNKNLSQDTILHLATADQDDPYRSPETVRVSDPQDENRYVDIEASDTIRIEAGKGFRYQRTDRWYDNASSNQSRAVITIRIYHNEVDDKFLQDVTDKKGRTTRQPPRDPDKYLEAVHMTNEKGDGSFFVDLIDKFSMNRAKGYQFQEVQYIGIWDNSLLWQVPRGNPDKVMPGAVEEKPGGEDPVRLDPLQVVINFGGISGLAVEFYPEGQ